MELGKDNWAVSICFNEIVAAFISKEWTFGSLCKRFGENRVVGKWYNCYIFSFKNNGAQIGRKNLKIKNLRKSSSWAGLNNWENLSGRNLTELVI